VILVIGKCNRKLIISAPRIWRGDFSPQPRLGAEASVLINFSILIFGIRKVIKFLALHNFVSGFFICASLEKNKLILSYMF